MRIWEQATTDQRETEPITRYKGDPIQARELRLPSLEFTYLNSYKTWMATNLYTARGDEYTPFFTSQKIRAEPQRSYFPANSIDAPLILLVLIRKTKQEKYQCNRTTHLSELQLQLAWTTDSK